MKQAEELEGISPEHYGRRKPKAADVQDLNTRPFYELVRQKIVTTTSIFAELISNYDLVLHSIASLDFHRVNTPKEPIHCTFTTL